MANIEYPVVNLSGEKVGSVTLSSEVFGIKDANEQVIHDAVVTQNANARQATAKTKKRHEVSGGGKKPWRQKGTGRARAGSSRSPIWVGGGKVFGPDGNQNYKLSQNKQAHALAMKTVLSQKVNHGLIIVDKMETAKVSSKEFVLALNALKANGKSLVVAEANSENLVLSARNLEKVVLRPLGNVSVSDILNSDNLIISKDAIAYIEGGLK